ncbi:MAG: LapD/MoxY N-terminal periplasmic domain-containing protein [Sulfurovum sp.]
MTLFKQVSIILLLIFVILFTLIMAVTFKIMKDSSQKSLYENVQNSTSSISLSITNAGSDLSSIKTVINASFDNGNYERIVFKDIDEQIIYEVKKDTELNVKQTPLWFRNLIEIKEVSAKSIISKNWKVLGSIEVFNDRTIFYNQTYSIFKSLIISLFVSLSGLLVLLFFLFKYILKPLTSIRKQSIAVMKNEFIIENNIPFTSEFKSVTLSTNSMIRKIEKMFENTNNVLKLNNELLYVDEVTKLNNRKYFIIKLDEFLEKDNPNNNGFISIVSLKIDQLNKTYGYQKTNDILIKFANLIKEDFNCNTNLIARLNGSEFAIVTPNIDENDAKKLISKFMKKVFLNLEITKDEIFTGLVRFEEEESLNKLLTKMDYVLSQTKVFNKEEYYYEEDIETIEKFLSKDEWKDIINISLEKNYFKLLHRDVLDTKSNSKLQETISFELNYENSNYSYKGLFPALLEQNKLGEVYLNVIEMMLGQKEIQNQGISIQLPMAFVLDKNNFSKLKELFVKFDNYENNKIVFEIEEETFSNDIDRTKMYINLFKEFNYGFSIFNFIANSNDYTYLKELKPLYIKASKYFLLESKQSFNILKILTESLNIKLIATSVSKTEDIETLSDFGIDAISGPILEEFK